MRRPCSKEKNSSGKAKNSISKEQGRPINTIQNLKNTSKACKMTIETNLKDNFKKGIDTKSRVWLLKQCRIIKLSEDIKMLVLPQIWKEETKKIGTRRNFISFCNHKLKKSKLFKPTQVTTVLLQYAFFQGTVTIIILNK